MQTNNRDRILQKTISYVVEINLKPAIISYTGFAKQNGTVIIKILQRTQLLMEMVHEIY